MPIGISAGTGALLAGGLGAAGAIGSAFIGSSAAKSASERMAQAGRESMGALRGFYDQTMENYKPYLDVGKNAIGSINSLYGYPDGSGNVKPPDYSQFTNSPDFAFAQQQGNLGLTRYLNATGMAQSGGAMKDMASYNQGLASQQYGNYFNRLMGLAGIGQNAANSSAQSAGQFGGQIAQQYGNIGQADASGIIGQGNAWSAGLQGAANSMQTPLLMNYWSSLRGGAGGAGLPTQSSYSFPPAGTNTLGGSGGGGINYLNGSSMWK